MIDGLMGDAVSIRHCRAEENTGTFLSLTDVKNQQLFMINGLANAKGDGKTLNTIAIQSAIDTACAHGGGIVVVPKGVYLAGSIYLRNGIELQLAKDAVF